MIKVCIYNFTVINPFLPVHFLWLYIMYMNIYCCKEAADQSLAAEARIWKCNTKNWPYQCRLMGASKGKYLWNTFISHDGWAMTRRGFKNGKLTSDSCCRRLHLLSPITSTLSRLAEVAIVWLFLSFPPSLPFMSFLFSYLSPASLSGCPPRPPTSPALPLLSFWVLRQW